MRTRRWLPLALFALISLLPPLAAQPQPETKKASPRLDHYGDPLPEHALVRIGTTRLWPGFQTAAMAFTADDKRLVTIAPESGGKVWDVATGKELVSFGVTESPVCALSTDGSLAAVIESATICRVYDTSTGREKHAFHARWSEMLKISFSPDNQLLAAVDRQDIVHVWNLASGAMVRWWADAVGYVDAYKPLAFLPDNKTLAVGCGPHSIKLWDATNGALGREFDLRRGAEHLAFSSVDGKTLLTAVLDDDLLVIFDVDTGEPLDLRGVWSRHGDYIKCFAFSQDGKKILMGRNEGGVSIFEVGSKSTPFLQTGRVANLDLQPSSVNRVAISNDGKKAAVVTGDGVIRFWSLESGAQINPRKGRESHLVEAQFDGDGKSVISLSHPWYGRWGSLSEDGSARLQVWDSSTALPKKAINLETWDQLHSLSGDGRLIASYYGGKLSVRNLATPDRGAIFVADLAKMGTADGNRHIQPYNLVVEGKYLVAEVWRGRREFMIWDTTTLKVALSVALPVIPGRSWFLSADGQLHVAHSSPQGGSNDSLYALTSLHIPTGRKVTRLLQSLYDVTAVSFSPSARLLALLDRKRSEVPLLETASGKIACRLDAGDHKLRCLVFSPNGQIITAGTEKGDILLWHLTQAKPIAKLVGHRGAVVSLSFSPDGNRLVSASDDTTMLVWDLSRWTDRAAVPSSLLGKDAANLWAQLAQDDPASAFAAIGKLLDSPKEAVAFLRKQLQPIKPGSTKFIADLIGDLDSNRFAVREQAMVKLQNLSIQAQIALEKTLAANPPLEVRLRVQSLLSKLENQPLAADSLQTLRGLELLEMLGTPDAADLLDSLSRGEPDAWLTQEAAASLERVRKRAAP